MARIMVIDDDPEMRSLLEQVLWSDGHDVITAEEGKTGLACSQAGGIELLVTDLVMPGMEGMETIRRFRKEFAGVPIIAISGNFNLGNVLDTAHRLGATRTLSKPFQPAEFVAVVRSVLDETRRASKQKDA